MGLNLGRVLVLNAPPARDEALPLGSEEGFGVGEEQVVQNANRHEARSGLAVRGEQGLLVEDLLVPPL